VEHRYEHSLVVIFVILFFIFCSHLVFANQRQELNVYPEQIILTLPKSQDQEFRLTTTLKPMKIIIDSNVDNFEFPTVTRYNDVVFKEMRFSKTPTGSRLVLEFKYLVPKPEIRENDEFIQIEIDKTYVQGSRRFVERGIIYGHQRRGDIFGPNVVNYLEVDLQQGIEVKLGLAQNKVFGSEYVSRISERFGAFAAVNGAYFAPNGRPLGVLMIDGELISEPYANRTALGMDGKGSLVMGNVDFLGEVLMEDGTFLFEVHGLNRPREFDELVAFNYHYGNQTNTNHFGHEVTVIDGEITRIQLGNSPIPPSGFVLSGTGEAKDFLETLEIGDKVQINTELICQWEETDIRQIIGGGPRLVRDGKVEITGKEERFQNDILIGRNPRTALGITADNKLLLVTVNGRQPNISVGMTLNELADFLIELGAVQAMNLDGGGSTTMVVRNLVLNIPSDGSERAVSNAIVVIASPE